VDLAFLQANLWRVGDLILPAADSLTVDGRRSVADPVRAVVVFDLSRLTPADPYRVFLALGNFQPESSSRRDGRAVTAGPPTGE
jgi:hypothetical protein